MCFCGKVLLSIPIRSLGLIVCVFLGEQILLVFVSE